MPTYDYQCKKCKHVFELFHSMSDETVKRCPRCKSKAAKVPSAGAGLLFKGSGFYITDYRSSSYKEQAKKEKSKSASDSGKKSGDKGGDKGGDKSGDKGGDKGGGKSDAKGKDKGK